MMFLSIIIGTMILYIISGIKIVNEYERGVKFFLGKYAGIMKPGLRIIVPFIMSWQRVDLRIKTIDVPAAMKQVSDPKASATVAYVSLTNGFQAYTALFQVPQGANSTGDKFTWTRGSLSITMYYEEGDNLTWKL